MKTITEDELIDLVRNYLFIRHYDGLGHEAGTPVLIFKNITNKRDMFTIGDIEKWRDGKWPSHTTSSLLIELCALGVLQPGDYGITL